VTRDAEPASAAPNVTLILQPDLELQAHSRHQEWDYLVVYLTHWSTAGGIITFSSLVAVAGNHVAIIMKETPDELAIANATDWHQCGLPLEILVYAVSRSAALSETVACHQPQVLALILLIKSAGTLTASNCRRSLVILDTLFHSIMAHRGLADASHRSKSATHLDQLPSQSSGYCSHRLLPAHKTPFL